MNKFFKDILIISGSTLIITFLVWFPHLLRLDNFFNLDFSSGFNTIYRNYDGLEYIVIAKSFYEPQLISSIPFTLPPNYYAAHFPGYSILILFFAPILGFLKSMLFISLFFTITSAVAFYFFVRNLKLTDHPLLLSLIFLVLPARWVIIHSVGSSEPVFIFFVITCLYFFIRFEQTKHFPDVILASLAGLGAQLTRPPGILLFIALALYIHWKYFFKPQYGELKRNWLVHLKYFPLVFIPLGLLGIFTLFQNQYGDFLAYFHSGDNIHLTLPPFSVFNKGQFWVGDIWLEDLIYIYIFGFLGGVYLIKQRLYPLAFFVLTFLTASVFIAHRDISRYVLPVFPFILIAFEKVLTSKEFRVILIIIALGIYLYSQNFIIQNTTPVPNLEYYN